ncbi:MAG: PIG-L family deacetylase [Anaerolineae bacterium]|jgi:LmbE family N-acetylglucosaminyl deacetylase|nr:PIG-L family deacetylase [Anaerolineae bacterium]
MSFRLLISYAHPDDESFGLGGLISKYVAAGVEVYYLCATNGDVGTVSPELLNGYASVAELRLSELAAASEILGFKKVYTLGYKDSGMMGSNFNQDPACLWYAGQSKPAEVTRRVVEVIRDCKPHVVLTFNNYGGYGHPDHIAIQRATTEAFTLAGDPAYVTGHEAWQPQKLYYSSIAKWAVQIGVWRARMMGKNPRAMGRNADIDIQAILDHVEPVHTRVDIRDWFEAWDRASACHKSQLAGGFRIVPKWARPVLTPYQLFTRIHPKPAHNRVDENDLFDGLTAER